MIDARLDELLSAEPDGIVPARGPRPAARGGRPAPVGARAHGRR